MTHFVPLTPAQDHLKTVEDAAELAADTDRLVWRYVSFSPDSLSLARDQAALVAWSAAEALVRGGEAWQSSLNRFTVLGIRNRINDLAHRLYRDTDDDEAQKMSDEFVEGADQYAHETYCEVPAWLSCTRAVECLDKILNHTKKVTP